MHPERIESGWDRWAAFVHRTRWVWIVVWPLLGVVIWALAPRISDLLHDSRIGFIPADMPSQRALATLHREFPADAHASRAIVVCVRAPRLNGADRTWVAQVARELAADRAGRGWRIKAAAVTPLIAPLLESPDGQASLIVADLPSELYTHHTVDSVALIKARLAEVPPPDGLVVEVTGSGALGELLAASARKNVDDTTFWTFVSVIVILAVIYRSPVAMSLPIVAVTASLMVSLGVIGWAAAQGLPISGLVEMFVIVVVVGSGVDYCLFLFARFREQIAAGAAGAEAARAALSRCGGAILASAGTNVAGLATLILARNRDIYTTGPMIAFAIAVATLAVLTLTPALMALAGRRLLWPARIRAEELSRGGLWSKVGRWVIFHPRRAVGWCLLLLIAAGAGGMMAPTLFDALEEYPPDTSFVRGARLVHRHLYAAPEATEFTVLTGFDEPLSDEQIDAACRRWTERFVDAVRGSLGDRLLYVRHAYDPLATAGGKRAGTAGETDAAGSSPPAGPLAERLARSYYVSPSRRTVRMDVGLAFDGHSAQATSALDVVRRLAHATAWFDPQQGAGSGGEAPGAASPVATQSGAGATLQASSQEAHASSADAARPTAAPTIQITGDAAMVEDMRALKAWDFAVVATAAVIVVYAILLWLLGDGLLAAFLVAATLLTFAAACGLTWAVFRAWTGVNGLNFRLEFLLFIILLSLGQDYNIYVVTRIREELRQRGPADAVALAVSRTGGVVSSCGIIMAATFASMISGSLLVMKQMAIGLALGILLDTFLVRPLLIPAATFLLLRARRGPRLKAC